MVLVAIFFDMFFIISNFVPFHRGGNCHLTDVYLTMFSCDFRVTMFCDRQPSMSPDVFGYSASPASYASSTDQSSLTDFSDHDILTALDLDYDQAVPDIENIVPSLDLFGQATPSDFYCGKSAEKNDDLKTFTNLTNIKTACSAYIDCASRDQKDFPKFPPSYEEHVSRSGFPGNMSSASNSSIYSNDEDRLSDIIDCITQTETCWSTNGEYLCTDYIFSLFFFKFECPEITLPGTEETSNVKESKQEAS